MLSSQSDRSIIKIYAMGLISLLLTGMIMFYFYKNIQHANNELVKQHKALLFEKSQIIDFRKNKNINALSDHLLSRSELCSSDAVLKQKIIFWVNQSQAQWVAIRFGTSMVISVIGSFSQDMSLLIALANTHIIFDINAIELSSVKNGIELQMDVTRDAVCD